MPLIPTLDGTPVEHSDIQVSDANQRMRSCLERLATPTCTKARQTVEKVAELWAGRDGTKMMRGVRVLPTSQAVRCLATLVRHQPPAVRICVFSALEYARELVTEASDEIGIGLRDEDPNVRLAAARLLAWVASSDDLVLSARESLADPVWSVRWHAVRALATWKAAPPDDLAATLLSTAPTPRLVDDWIRAAESIHPMPSELARRVDDLRQQLRA